MFQKINNIKNNYVGNKMSIVSQPIQIIYACHSIGNLHRKA